MTVIEDKIIAGPSKNSDRKRMIIYRASDAVDVQDGSMAMEGMDAAVVAGLTKMAQANVPPGTAEKTTMLFCEPGENGMSLAYAWFKSGYVLPRHSHNADCLYFIMGGELHMGAHVLRKGDGFFVPADHAYGYEAGPEGVEVLEFRNATKFNFVFKGNDEAHWDKIATTYGGRAGIWKSEDIPPSER